jgi:hypothetical protein
MAVKRIGMKRKRFSRRGAEARGRRVIRYW